MKKIIENIKLMGLILLIVAVIAGIGYGHFKLWRAEHPNAKTFTYFFHVSR